MKDNSTVIVTFRDGFERTYKNVSLVSYGIVGEWYNPKTATTETAHIPFDSMKFFVPVD